MTSTQFMQMTPFRMVFTAMWLLWISTLSACGPKLTQPALMTSPYEHTQVWAVAPFTNESGVSLVEGDKVADQFVHQVQDIRGVNAIPVNRVIVAMRELDMPHVRSAHDAAALMSKLGVDGIIIGTVTAYDPYRPMTLGAAIELHLADQSHRSRAVLDTRSLSRSTNESYSPASLGPGNPVAQAAGVFDARNHETLAWLKHYATGRTTPDSAYGQDIYLVRMDLYTQFVSYRLLHDLLDLEWNRLSPIVQESQQR